MIEARSSPRFERLFAVYAAWTVRRHFRAVYVRGTLPDTRAPLLVCVHHAGWWDPILLFHLSRRRFPGRHFTMMEEANLRRFGVFRRLGAFGIDRASKNGPLASLRYALKRLSEPTSRVWIFPQGTITPVDRRPINVDPGAAWLATRAGVPVVAVAIRYEFREDQLPEAFVSFSLPELVRVERTVDEDPVRELLTSEADGLRDAVWSGGLDEFERVVSGRRSISDRFRPS
ncbi:MAG: lysophospholipid acyltransferase family protein [Blastocatellia bacterium]|nr:lysophospholipid acyltransferase family protein [Blastocatellia bacterium]